MAFFFGTNPEKTLKKGMMIAILITLQTRLLRQPIFLVHSSKVLQGKYQLKLIGNQINLLLSIYLMS